MQQTFQLAKEPRIRLIKVNGDLEVRGWDRQEISVEWNGDAGDLQPEDNVLTLNDCRGDVELRVPYDTEIRVEGSLSGDAEADSVRRIELKNVRGDVKLKNIGIDVNLEGIDETVLLENIAGDVSVRRAASVRIKKRVGADVTLAEVPLIEIETVGADLTIQKTEMVSIGSVGGDLEISDLQEGLHCGSIGGDCQIKASGQAEIQLGNIGGDLEIKGATKVEVGNVGGDGDLSTIGGEVVIGRVGSDAQFKDLQGSIQVGGIGGDLELQGGFPAESKTHLLIGGDAKITLPANANLALQATVGGSVSGPSVSFSGSGNLVRLVYGEGSATCNLSVGGDLELHGGSNPRVNSTSLPWGEFGQEMANLGQEMAKMGQDLGKMGVEFGQSIAEDVGNFGVDWTANISQIVQDEVQKARNQAEEHVRKARQHAEGHARKAEERAQKAQERAGRTDRMYVRVNEREWQMNPERFNDLVAKAQKAAMEGVAGAMEAVEHAVSNLKMPLTPRPAQPPVTPPAQPVPPVQFSAPGGQPVPEPVVPTSEQSTKSSLEQEREAILRMIAEGRITPEEGDMLLEGLGD
jgi:hypothetical protein